MSGHLEGAEDMVQELLVQVLRDKLESRKGFILKQEGETPWMF